MEVQIFSNQDTIYLMKTAGYELSFPMGSSRKVRINPSANAWWNDHGKVTLLLIAFSNYCTIEEACTQADITLKQYKYFVEKHPDFSELRVAYRSLPSMKAQKTIIDNLDNIPTAKWWLEKKVPQEFGPSSRRGRKMIAAMNLHKEVESPYSPELEAKINNLAEEYNKKYRDLIVEGRLEKSPKKPVAQKVSEYALPVKPAPVVPSKLTPEQEAREKFKYGIG